MEEIGSIPMWDYFGSCRWSSDSEPKADHLTLFRDHSIFRAFNKGALGILSVTGEENEKIFAGEIMEGIYLPEGSTIQKMPKDGNDVSPPVTMTKSELIDTGKKIYMQACFACHQANGEGVANAFPPLANADYLNADVNRSIDVLLHGLSGEITVNGKIQQHHAFPAAQG